MKESAVYVMTWASQLSGYPLPDKLPEVQLAIGKLVHSSAGLFDATHSEAFAKLLSREEDLQVETHDEEIVIRPRRRFFDAQRPSKQIELLGVPSTRVQIATVWTQHAGSR